MVLQLSSALQEESPPQEKGKEKRRRDGGRRKTRTERENRAKETGQKKSTPLSKLETVFTVTVILAPYPDSETRFSSDQHKNKTNQVWKQLQ